MSELIVSVIIPTYNRADMVAKSIDSVLAQDFDGFEVIVSDDGSTDNTQDALSNYKGRIAVVFGPNKGTPTAITRAMQSARGEFFSLLGSDDLMLPGSLATQAEFMKAHPEVAAVTGNIIVQGQEQVNYLERYGIDFCAQPWVILDRPFQKLLCKNFMADPASMVRRECFLSVGGYDLSLRRSADWDLWLKMARQWSLACINMPCTWVGKHEENRTISPVELACNIRIMDKALRCGEPLDQHALEAILKRLFGQIKGYIISNFTGPAEPLWQLEVRRCAEHLPWHQRLLVGLMTAFPRKLSSPLLRQVIKTRAAFRERRNHKKDTTFLSMENRDCRTDTETTDN